ncbi:MAG: FAD-binding oxidoreductase [Actinomycetota bacterium]
MSPTDTAHAAGLDAAIAALVTTVGAATAVVPVGGRTHWEVGGPVPTGTEVRAPAGIVEYDPAELTVTVGAGTRVGDLDATLAAAGQQCPLDPRDPDATVGGVLATGLSGLRRLRYGPVRNRLLEVHLVLGDGRRVKGGGRTVKNVSGYDVARLVVGSFGTLGVLTQVTLRCEPLPPAAAWFAVEAPGLAVLRAGFRPAAVLVGPGPTSVLLEGFPADIAAEAARVGGVPTGGPPSLPAGPHRGRASVAPAKVDALVQALTAAGVAALGEAGVGTVHVAASTAEALAIARALAHDQGGWMLREAGGGADDGFGVALPNRALMARIRDALDPEGTCNPGRLPLASRAGGSA